MAPRALARHLGKLGFELFKRLEPSLAFLDVDPPLGVDQDIVIGEDEKWVVVFAIPRADHFEVVVAVAPMRVGVKVVAIPTESVGGLQNNGLSVGFL